MCSGLLKLILLVHLDNILIDKPQLTLCTFKPGSNAVTEFIRLVVLVLAFGPTLNLLCGLYGGGCRQEVINIGLA